MVGGHFIGGFFCKILTQNFIKVEGALIKKRSIVMAKHTTWANT